MASKAAYQPMSHDEPNLEQIENGEVTAGFFSRIFFHYVQPVLSAGFKAPLQQEQLPPMHPGDRSGTLSKRFQALWDDQVENNPTPSLWKAILAFIGRPYAMVGILKLWSDFVQFAPAFLLGRLLDHVSSPNPELWVGLIWVFALLLSGATGMLAWNNYFLLCLRAGQHVRSCIVQMIYEKSFRLSNEGRRKYTQGEIVNFASVDAKRIGNFFQWLHVFWSSPLQLILALSGLFSILGASALAGVALMILVLPLTYIIQRKTGAFQDKMMSFKDERVKLLNEALQAIRVIKFFAWEEKFEERLESIREKEVGELWWIRLMGQLTDLLWILTPPLVNIVSFLAYSFSGHELTLYVVFSSMILFNILRWPLISLPWVLSDTMQARVSVDRVKAFLESEELEQFELKRRRAGAVRKQQSAAEPDSSVPVGDALVDLDEDEDDELAAPAESAAVARINAALSSSDSKSAPVVIASAPSSGKPIIRVDNATFAWAKTSEKPELRNINLTASEGQLVVVIGHVGSGKSSLLSALLGEMRTTHGHVSVSGSVAYAAQQPWIMHDTVKHNITLGLDFDNKKYRDVIECCALVRDLEILPGGSSCEIGEKGVSLSGGQKARVAFARCVYRDADVYFLDDVFSAVDVHVAKHIFEEAILKQLAGKTRVLVTHHYFTLPKADLVVYMKDGEIAAAGTYEQLQSMGISLLDMMTDVKGKQPVDADAVGDEEALKAVGGIASPTQEARSAAQVQDDEDEGKAVQAEERETGTLKGSILKEYVMLAGFVVSILIVLATIGDQAMSMYRDYYLSNWARSHQTASNSTAPVAATPASIIRDGMLGLTPDAPAFLSAPSDTIISLDEVKHAMGIYVLIAFIAAALRIGEEVLMMGATLRASRAIHDRTLMSVFRAPIRFFDTTPIGRILNRFSKDQDAVDNEISPQLQDFLTCLTAVIASIVFLVAASPLLSLSLIPVAIAYYYITEYFRRSSRELQRLQSISASPIFSHFSESLNGVSTLRAFQLERKFSSMCLDKIDTNNQSQITLLQVNRWLSVRLATIGVGLTALTALSGVVSKSFGISNPVLFGLSLTYAMPLVENLNWMVRCLTGVETNMTSVERMKQYQEIEHEAPRVIPSKESSLGGRDSWPRNGKIEFRDFQMRYRDDLPPVLNGITCTIPAGQKVGICGRTGAGKSSLLLALFRLVEACGGSILIDGVDISTIGLARLRSSMSIIPQDPTLFAGTIRSNLDPFNEYTDDDLWTVLRRCSMFDKISALSAKLDTEVSENGSNFSVGERQLLCLARALCHKSKIILLDEATAAVDFETDALIQATVRKEFTDATVLTIAHRINTIMDYDRIILMNQGSIVEQGSPTELMANPQSQFAQMVHKGH